MRQSDSDYLNELINADDEDLRENSSRYQVLNEIYDAKTGKSYVSNQT